MKLSPYILASLVATLIATVVGAIVSGAVGAMIGLSVVGLILATGYLVRISVQASEHNRK